MFRNDPFSLSELLWLNEADDLDQTKKNTFIIATDSNTNTWPNEN